MPSPLLALRRYQPPGLEPDPQRRSRVEPDPAIQHQRLRLRRLQRIQRKPSTTYSVAQHRRRRLGASYRFLTAHGQIPAATTALVGLAVAATVPRRATLDQATVTRVINQRRSHPLRALAPNAGHGRGNRPRPHRRARTGGNSRAQLHLSPTKPSPASAQTPSSASSAARAASTSRAAPSSSKFPRMPAAPPSAAPPSPPPSPAPRS